MDADAIQEKYGVAPQQLIEVKSLMGDTSDNIPACRALAKRPPLPWCRRSARWRACTSTSTTSASSPNSGSTCEHKPMAELSHTLGTIRTDAPIDTAEGTTAVGEGPRLPPCAAGGAGDPLADPPLRAGRLPGSGCRQRQRAAGGRACSPALLPLAPEGRLWASRAPATWTAAGTPCRRTVYPLEDADLSALLDNAGVHAGCV